MTRKSSTRNSAFTVVGMSVVFYIAMCGAESTETRVRGQRDESDVESSITSGLRSLELIRREIIDSRNARTLSSIEEPGTSGYRRYAGPTMIEEHNSKVRSPGSRLPRRQVDLGMYEALSKIANVQIADPRIDHYTGSGSTGRRDSLSRFHHSVDDERSKHFYRNFGPTGTLKNGGKFGPKASIVNSKRLPVGPKKFRCRPAQEIYIPKAEKKLPAYLCTLGNRGFVISSERFLRDTRKQLEVVVDEDTFRRLKPLSSGSPRLTSEVSVLPATLVLKPGENGYTVRGSSSGQLTPSPGDEIQSDRAIEYENGYTIRGSSSDQLTPSPGDEIQSDRAIR